LRHLQPGQKLGQSGLALHLLEACEIGQRDAEISG